MSRPQGLSKTGGRRKGTPNRKTVELADQLLANGIDVVTELVKTLPDLDAKDKANILLNLMNFLHPKRKAIEVRTPIASDDKCFKITFVDPVKNE